MAIFIIIGVIVLLYIVIDWERQNKPNNMKYPTEYKYDERGNKIEWNSYYYNGRLSSKTTYKYNLENPVILTT